MKMDLEKTRRAAERFCRAYNRRTEEVFEALTADLDPRRFEQAAFFEEVQRETLNALASWYDLPLPELGRTPAALIDALDEPEAVLAFFEVCAQRCDRLIPEYLQIHMGRRAEELLPALCARALALPFAAAEDAANEAQVDVQCASLELLGQWGQTAPLEGILAQFEGEGVVAERLADACKSYFIHCGAPCRDALLASAAGLLDAGREGANLEYLLIYLCELGRQEPSEAIYQLLRRACRTMRAKVVAVICLGDYGDGRAVPMLRALAERLGPEADRQLYAETLSSIKRLGGLIEDLPRLRT